MTLIQTIERKIGFPIIEDRFVGLALFGFYASYLNGAYIGNAFGQGGEKILLTPQADRCKWSILFHELAHATGVEGRLERSALLRGGYDYKSHASSKNMEEQIAERSSMALMEYFSIANEDAIQKSQAYLKEYPIETTCMAYVERETSKAIEYILTYWLKDVVFNPMAEEMRLMERIKQFMGAA